MSHLTGGQALIQALALQGVRVVFGIPGAGQYEAIDALYQKPEIRYISVRHEQAATFMADAYARVSGQIAAALVVPGPGLFYASAGIATAFAVSSPMLVVTGTNHHDPKHPAGDDLAWLRPLTKWAARASSPAEIPDLVHEAFRQLRSGRPRPVAIEIPAQVFAATEEVEPALKPALPSWPGGDPELIQQAARMLIQARRPVIWAGGGVHTSNASAILTVVAEHLQAPVITTRSGKGAISDHHPLSLGFAELRYTPLREWLEQRDMILAVGTSRDFSRLSQPVIHIDIDPASLSAGANGMNIQGDARATLETLHQILAQQMPARTSTVAEEVRAINAARFDPTRQLQPQWSFMQTIRRTVPENGILVQGMNQMGYYSRNYWPVYHPRTYLTASAHGTLGCAYPLALGAKVAQPDRAVVALCGDGGFLYNAQELATAVQYGIHAVAIVFNDNAYGNVLRAQIEMFNGHILGTQLHNPDFVALAQAFGAHGIRATDAPELEAALRAALALEAPALIEVPVGRMEREF